MLIRQDGLALCVDAPAKLNLFLEVLGRRGDGFHELETLMVAISLHDTLRFTEEPTPAIRLRCHGRSGVDDSVPSGDDNLVVQAAKLLQAHSGTSRGAAIDLWKRIPVSAGLAGGSTDAAATLVALDRLWELGLSSGELLSLAAELGSDVAFFVRGVPAAICRGRGEEIHPVERSLELSFVVARPASGLSTAEVYRHCQVSSDPRSAQPLVELLADGRLADASRFFHNSLQQTASRLNREVTDLITQLDRHPVLASAMTGSGTACFGLCATDRSARRIAGALVDGGVPWASAVRTRA
jgi:4-diphosphocytidyl-2-C-methyl-D-erythritol kinase